jgi:hypothetical protein
MKLARSLWLLIGVSTVIPAAAWAQSPDDDVPAPAPAPVQNTQNNNTNPTVVVQPQNTQPAVVAQAAPPPPTVIEPSTPPASNTFIVPSSSRDDRDIVYDRWNAPVFTTGALVFAATYGTSVIAAASSNHPGAERLYVPVLGPWLALGDWGSCPVSQPSCDSNTTDKVLLVADGVFQAAALIAMVDGLIAPSHHHVIATTAVNDKNLHVTPAGNGFALFSHF